MAEAWASPPGTAWAYLSSVVDTRRWSRRRETTTIGTPASSISVAMKWRRSCSRNGRSPAARRWRRKALVTLFGFHAVVPPSSLNTNPSALRTGTLGMVSEHGERALIEVDDMTALGLRGREHRAVGSFDPTGTERDPARVEVDVVPTQPEQLCTPGARDRREIEEDVQRRLAVANVIKQAASARPASAGAARRWKRRRGGRVRLGCPRSIPIASPARGRSGARRGHERAFPATTVDLSLPRRDAASRRTASMTAGVTSPTARCPRCGWR